MFEYTKGNCKDCNKIILMDEVYRHVGKTLFDGIICEDCITKRDLRKIGDYIAGCEDDNGYVFDSYTESLLYDASNIIQRLQDKIERMKDFIEGNEYDLTPEFRRSFPEGFTK